MLEHLATSVLVLNPDGRIVELNAAAENLVSVSRQRGIGKVLSQLLPSEGNELGELIRLAETSGLSYAQDLNLPGTPDHPNERVVDCRVTPLQLGGEPRILVEMADVTRRHRLHRDNALLQQHGASRKMVRQLAHEIKNPLGGIRGSAQLLARRLDGPGLTDYTDVIIAEADRLVQLVDSLLGPGTRSDKQAHDIHGVLEHVARLLEAGAGRREPVRRDYDVSLPKLRIDRDQLIQAVLNLATNAAAAAGPDGAIVFRTRAVTNYTIGDTFHRVIASIEVEDDGPGIPPDIVDSIFFPLVTGTEGGTGLGLSLAQELVHRHDGLIEFETRPGRTVFQLRLPLPEHG